MTALPQTREQYSAHIPALHMLVNLGWRFLSTADALTLRGSTRDVILKPRLIEALQARRFEYKGEHHPLSPSGIDQILRQVQALNLTEGLMPANERFYQMLTLGVTITEFMPDGKRHQPTVALIDWQEASANRWEVTEELKVLSTQGTHHRAPDMVAYVNGLPLVVIEAKRPDAARIGQATVEEGISQQLRNQRHDEIPQLYAYAQLLLAISAVDGRYGTTATPLKFWARWREEAYTEAQMSEWKNRPLVPEVQAALFEGKPAKVQAYFRQLWSRPLLPSDQDRLLASLMQPERLLEFLRLFVLFDRKAGKVVARYQQFFGIRALLERINQRKPDGGREGGVVWHTTGSGKSLTMVFLTKALVLHPNTQACRVLVVTDRLDLEDQLARNFMNSGAFGSAIASKKEGEKSKVGSGRELAQRIGQGTERIIFTLIQKFITASKFPECYNPSADLIVLVDEGHRSHGGETHERMRNALPRAAYVAFTGTPLLKKEKTANKFGSIVHAYTMRRAVEDGTVAPLLYEERVPELSINEDAVNRWFDRIAAGLSASQSNDLKRKYASKRAVYGATNRIELIAWDIAQHFNENVKKLDLGLKGQVATASKLDAIRYKQYLDDTGLVSSAVIISPPDSREGNTEVDESKLPEVQKWWDANVGRNAEAYEEHVLRNFGSDAEPDLLIVVDRLLTGFDEPRNAVLYIDKPLKEHSLIQAVARVNRLHEAKRYGLLVDYRGILKELDIAVRAYQDLEARTQGGYELADIEGLYQQISTEYKQLPALHQALWAIFSDIQNPDDIEAFRQVLMPRYAEDEDGHTYDTRQKVRDDFYQALTKFGLCLQTALSSRSFFEDHDFSEAKVERYKADLRRFLQIRKIARQDALEAVDYSVYDQQIRGLVDKQVIGTQIREPEGVYLVHELGQPQDVEQWSEEKTRNETDMIRTRLKKTIEQDLADDPYAQQVFADLLKQAIAEAEAMFDHPLKQYALFKRFEEKVAARELDEMPQGLGDSRHARAYFGICRMVLGDEAYKHADQDALVQQAKHIDDVVQKAVAEHSLNPQNIEAVIRKSLLPALFGLMGLDKAKEAIEQVIQVTRVGLARGGY
ncbi:type I restriction endonuclease subunit R [Achromobacter insolitus]|uniref:type I restriction endonuclease subunit R n=1 Tax=Achromobacter insolitus TaxID=217204 RepID=UPI0011EAF9CB|nr:type I restriction endonuclease subunit R [Achromobacter insolitus]QEK90315.1 type I restriction endonuclease subunit R [Achromobacter insolitus]